MSVHNAPERIGFLLVVLGFTFVKIEMFRVAASLFLGRLAFGLAAAEFGAIGIRCALFFSAQLVLAGLTEIDDLGHYPAPCPKPDGSVRPRPQ